MISVFTPSHDVTYLTDCYRSLLAQDYTDWEWVLLINGDAKVPQFDADERVVIRDATDTVLPGVGGWKALAAGLCNGEILVELDHDDMLAPNCLTEIHNRFATHPGASFVYGNTVQIEADGKPNDDRYRAGMGWEYRHTLGQVILPPDADEALLDSTYTEIVAFEPTPHNVSQIWFAPNHPRAFRSRAYLDAGGYDTTQEVCDDQDLMARLYQVGEFVHIDAPLYLQRVHDKQTQLLRNAEIQDVTLALYERDVAANARAWAQRAGLLALDVGCGNACADGFIGVDALPRPGVDVLATLPDLSMFPDSTVGVLRMADVLEHVADKIALMRELHRVLAPGGMLLTLTPSTDGRGAFQDPTHVSYWNENSFWYYTDDAYRRHSPQTADLPSFQVSRVRTYFPSDWHSEHRISYVQANLIAIKSNTQPRNGGELLVGADR